MTMAVCANAVIGVCAFCHRCSDLWSEKEPFSLLDLVREMHGFNLAVNYLHCISQVSDQDPCSYHLPQAKYEDDNEAPTCSNMHESAMAPSALLVCCCGRTFVFCC